MTAAVYHLQAEPAEVEPHTDCPDYSEIAIAYEALVPVTDGDRTAAAILALGAVLAENLQRIGRR